jgi:hypothetical protein
MSATSIAEESVNRKQSFDGSEAKNRDLSVSDDDLMAKKPVGRR